MTRLLSPARRMMLLAASFMLVTGLPYAAQAAPEGSIKIAVGADTTTFHPHVNSLPVGNAVDMLVFEQLFRMGADNKVVPELAKTWNWSEDGMTFTVTFETGHVFSNGDPLDAEDIAASFNQLLDPKSGSIYAGLYASLGKAEAKGADTVVFHLTEKNGHILMLLANSAAGIIDVKANTAMGAEYGRKPVGSGPYMIDQFIGGERFSLVPNPKYSGKLSAKLKKIEFMTVPEDGARMALIETGEADIVDRVPAESIGEINDTGTAKVILPDSMFSISMELLNSGPLADPRVREALNISIDRDGMIKGILGGLATPSVGMVGPGTQDELRATFPPKPFDTAKAKQLLADAGYGPDKKLSLVVTCPNGRYIKDSQVCQALAAQWQAIGIDAKPQVLDLSNWAANSRLPLDQRKDNMTMVGRATAGIDFTLYRLFKTGVSTNISGFSDPTVDKLLAEGRATSDVAEQKKIYGEIQKTIWDKNPYVFLWYQKQALGVSDKVHGFAIRPDETMIFDNVTVSSN
ncbi:ABC transporter substrate-binding protein [Neorhizobium sp. NCHU2750]|uniref:ABC transporter substrate-binding protein n=1 Tax=Neorhizobium sp. NCHU2750 TaxID=1825976 RepID=UPI000EB68F41|nr:peptide/nickel ABC transporter substrate-binding protein [Neorhizobium sp. NCHU2750]